MLISAWNPYDDNITSPAPQPISIKGRSMKRIVRTLTIESSGGSRLTYEKSLLNSRKNSHFCKTNQPCFPHTLPHYPLHVFARHDVPKQSRWGCRGHKALYFARNDNTITDALLVYLYWLKRVIDASLDTDTMTIRRDTNEKN